MCKQTKCIYTQANLNRIGITTLWSVPIRTQSKNGNHPNKITFLKNHPTLLFLCIAHAHTPMYVTCTHSYTCGRRDETTLCEEWLTTGPLANDSDMTMRHYFPAHYPDHNRWSFPAIQCTNESIQKRLDRNIHSYVNLSPSTTLSDYE